MVSSTKVRLIVFMVMAQTLLLLRTFRGRTLALAQPLALKAPLAITIELMARGVHLAPTKMAHIFLWMAPRFNWRQS